MMGDVVGMKMGLPVSKKQIIRGNPFPSGPATGGCSIPSTSQLVRQGRLGHPVSQAGTELGYCLQHRNPFSPEDLLPPSRVTGMGVWLGAPVLQ